MSATPGNGFVTPFPLQAKMRCLQCCGYSWGCLIEPSSLIAASVHWGFWRSRRWDKPFSQVSFASITRLFAILFCAGARRWKMQAFWNELAWRYTLIKMHLPAHISELNSVALGCCQTFD